MIALLASPLFRYGMAIAGVLAALGGLYGYGHHQGALSERAHWEAAIAEQKAQAAQLIADRVAENNALEAKSEALNAKLEQDHAAATQEIDAAHADYDRAVADRLRIQRSRPSSCPAGASEAPNPGSGQSLESPGIFISQRTLTDLGNLAAGADELVATMKACQVWAATVGR